MKPKRTTKDRKKPSALLALVVDYLGNEIPRTVHVFKAPFCREHPERAIVKLEVDMRLVDTVTLRPVRRPFMDRDGIIQDALRLANT